jgi:ATP-dependent helicase/nuclease subunit A
MSAEVERIVTSCFDEQLCVVAVAGSGKTRMLSERFIAAVRQGRADTGQILALTFTDKAATEMRERIVGAFARAGEHAYAQAAYDASISTIHAFCARLLHEYALEAGLPPSFEVLDEGEATLVFRECWEAACAQPDFLPVQQGQAWPNLDAESVYNAMWRLYREARTHGWDESCLRRIVAREVGELVSRWEEDARRAVLDAARRGAESVAALTGQSLWQGKGRVLKMEQLRAELAEALAQAGGAGDPREPMLRALRAADELRSALRKPPRSAPPEAVEAVAGIVRERLWPRLQEAGPAIEFDAEVEREFAACGQAFARAALRVWELYEHAKAEQGVLDYDDLQTRAIGLLNDAAVQRRLRARYRLLLVDEFQDTNRLQVEILERLAPPERVFVVGDAWQSIYGFRGADVGVFLDYVGKARTQKSGARVLRLPGNRRSRPQILSFVNEFISRTAGSPPYGGPTEFERLCPASSFVEKAEPSIEVLLLEGLATESRKREAATIARRAQELRGALRITREGENQGRAVTYGDMVLLLRATGSLHIYEEGLRRAGVPCHITGAQRFFVRNEVRDLANLLDLVVDPGRNVPLAAALRSPLVRASDDALVLIARLGDGGDEPLWEKLRRLVNGPQEGRPEVPARERERLEGFVAKVEELRALRDRCSLGELVQRAVAAFDLDAKVLALPDGRRMLANLRKVVDLATAMGERPFFHLADLVEMLRELRDLEQPESEAPLDPERDSLRIMTIHQAKGLEAPIVFVADLGRGRHRADLPPFALSAQGELGVRRALPGGEACEGYVYKKARLSNERMETEEERRLLYVALTRAQEHLILSGHASSQASGGERSAAALLKEAFPELDLGRPGHQALKAEDGSVGVRVLGAAQVEQAEGKGGRPLLEVVPSDWAAGEEPLPSGLWPVPAKERTRLIGEAGQRLAAIEARERMRLAPRVVAVTALADYFHCPHRFWLRHQVGFRPAWGGLGEREPDDEAGAEFGQAVHEALARLAFEPETDAAVVADVRRQGAWEAADLLAGFLASGLYSEVRRAESRFTEVPFSFLLGDTLVEGRIDLLFCRGGQWSIADYKTHRLAAGEAERLAEHFRPQLELYALAAARGLGAAPAAVRALFLRTGEEIAVASTSERIAEVERKAARALQDIAEGRFPFNASPLCDACEFRDGVHCAGVRERSKQ